MTDECYGTGFALSGGFVKGYAHLGALQALFEYGIRPEIIAGVSIGAVAGVFIADGKRPEEVLELFMSREFRSFTGFTRSRGGFMNLDNFYGFLRDTLSVGRIEELSLPLAVTATNLDTGRSVHFREGEIAPRIAASCCVPGLFTPIEIEGDHYVDGGVLMNLLTAVLCLLLSRIAFGWLAAFLIMMCVAGVCFALTNGIPRYPDAHLSPDVALQRHPRPA